jgi:hypothetical protein
VLIDEYDKPLLQHFEAGEKEPSEIKNQLRSFYSVLKSADKYIRFAFVTGVSKFAKISLFSDMNSIRDITFDESYSTICGFTQQELEDEFGDRISELTKEENITYEQTLSKLKEYYDGYQFTEKGEKVYNPYSTLNCFADKRFGSYWFSSATPTLLIEKIKTADYDITQLEDKISIDIRKIEGYKADSKDPIPLLYQTGYLTIKGTDEFGDLLLGYPNKEVQYAFDEDLIDYFSEKFSSTIILAGKIRNCLKTEDLQLFFSLLDNFYEQTPYLFNDGKEKTFQGIFSICLRGAVGPKEDVKTEDPSSRGRSDILVKFGPKVYVFELKVVKQYNEQEIKTKLTDALVQIDKQRYGTSFEKNDKQVVKVAVVFSSQDKNIVGWQRKDELPQLISQDVSNR